MIGAKEAQEVILDRVSCIHFPVQFRKDKKVTIQALIDLGSKVYIMTPAYTKWLGHWTQKTDIGAQKIDGLLLEIFKIVIAVFQVINTFSKIWFFQEIFPLTNTS